MPSIFKNHQENIRINSRETVKSGTLDVKKKSSTTTDDGVEEKQDETAEPGNWYERCTATLNQHQ